MSRAPLGAPPPARRSAIGARLQRLRRALSAAPELVTAVAAALVFASVLQWRYRADRAEFQGAASAIDNSLRARLHLAQAYLIARSLAAGDESFSAPDADAELDRARMAVDDWVRGRTTPTWSNDVPLDDPVTTRIALRYRAEIQAFRGLLRAPERPGKSMDLLRAYSALAASGDSIGGRAALILAARERKDRAQHETTVFVVVLITVLAGGLQHRAADAARKSGERVRKLQRLTAALAVARTPEDVADAVAVHGIGASEAAAGVLVLETADGHDLSVVARVGSDPDSWPRLAADLQPLGVEIRTTRQPLFVENRQALECRLPPSLARQAPDVHALAVVPLSITPQDRNTEGDGLLGFVTFAFAEDQAFSPGARRFLETIGDLAAQAMERARTYVAERGARAEAHRERERLALILERLPIGVVVSDAEGRVVLANQAAEELLAEALLPGELVHRHDGFTLLHDDGLPLLPEDYPLSRALRGETVVGEAMRVRTIAGRTVPVAMTAAPGPPRSDGRPAFAVKAVFDITSLEQAQRALRESEARLRQMAERLPVGIFVTDAAGRVTWGNPRLGEILGATVEAILRDGIIAFIAEEDRARMVEERRRFRATGPDAARFEFRVRHAATGRLREVVMESSAQRGPTGATDGTVDVVEDVTEQRALEAQLAQSQKMEAIGRLAGGVAHDFNNLLTAMLASTELLLEDTAPEDPRREELHAIRTAVVRAAALTGQLLAFSRRQVIQPRAIDVNALAREAETLLARVIGEDVELELVLTPTLPHAHGDPGQVQQALMNLAVNARDAMPQGGALLITTRLVPAAEVLGAQPGEPLDHAYVALTVSDTGVGMDAETRARVFEPFFTTKDVGKGTGLGLSMVYGALAQMGGRVAVESAPGKGSTFHLYLPLATQEHEAAPAPAWRARTPPRGSRGTATQVVLLVEDDPALRRAMQRMLERAGFQVLPAGGADEALAIARTHPGHIDAVLTDVVMKGTGGREMSEAIARVRPEAAIAFMSGYTADVVLRQRVSDGEAFIQKPFTPDELVAFVRGVIGGSKPDSGS